MINQEKQGIMAKKLILVVDDEKDFVIMIKLRLEANGYEVITAFDGSQGVALAQKKKPDLIILDIMMPAGDGYFVCQRLKMSSFTWATPIIFLTAKGTPEAKTKAYELGAKYYLGKPYDPKVLLETVEKALESSEQNKEASGLQKRILVIEKQSQVTGLVKSKLEECGYEAIIASSMEEGLEKAEKEKPNLVLLDGALAKENDYNGFYQLKLKYTLSEMPIIISTIGMELEGLQKKLEGVTSYCLKPFNYIDLLGRVKSALGENQNTKRRL